MRFLAPLMFGRRKRRRSSGGADADATDFNTRVVAAGFTLSVPARAAVNAFCLAAKSHGYWAKLLRINLQCGDQIGAALIPLKVGAGTGYAADLNNGATAATYAEATGFASADGASLLSQGFDPTIGITINDSHIAVYSRVAGGSFGLRGPAGSFDLTGSGTQTKCHLYGGGGAELNVTTGSRIGFFIATRTGAALYNLYQNGASIASNVNASGSFPTTNLFVFTPGTTPGRVSAYSIGLGLSAALAASYNTDMEAFQDALSRGVQ